MTSRVRLNKAVVDRTALTKREREVVQLIAEGLGNKEIGTALGISEHTAHFHVDNVIRKLGGDGRVVAAVTAMRMGLVTFPPLDTASIAG